MTAPFAQHARRYADQGFAVYPLLPGGRTPCTRHGFKDASQDPDQITRWARWRPDANIAVVSGEAAAFSVIDIDRQHGGFETLARFERDGHVLPIDAYYTTPGGGWHILLAYHPALKTGAHRLGPGIDFVNGNGTPVPPTQLADGRRYTWQAWPAGGLKALPPVPQWVLDYIEAERAAKEAERKSSVRHAEAFRMPETEFARRRLAAFARAGLHKVAENLGTVKKGERNRALFDAVCSLGRYVHHGVMLRSELTSALLAPCKTNGLIEANGIDDALATIERALTKSAGDELPNLVERRV
jgi:hypothetical protein